MRKITIEKTLYKYNEASEELKEKILERYHDINTAHYWCDYIEFELKELNADLIEFDLHRYRIEICFNNTEQTARDILNTHGKQCETYKISKEYINKMNYLKKEIDKHGSINTIESETLADGLKEILEQTDETYKQELSSEYLSLLQKHYDYLTSREGIEDTIEANDYEFTEDGKIF